jgi:hypothetical protein
MDERIVAMFSINENQARTLERLLESFNLYLYGNITEITKYIYFREDTLAVSKEGDTIKITLYK